MFATATICLIYLLRVKPPDLREELPERWLLCFDSYFSICHELCCTEEHSTAAVDHFHLVAECGHRAATSALVADERGRCVLSFTNSAVGGQLDWPCGMQVARNL